MAGKHFSLMVHFIWSTAGREPWIGDDWRAPLHAYIGGIMRNKNYDRRPGECGKVELFAWVHETFPNRRGFAWQEGYGAFSVLGYIRGQKHHHSKRSFKDEFLEFLERYEVEYDERYLWD